jgi:hypothetical protein
MKHRFVSFVQDYIEGRQLSAFGKNLVSESWSLSYDEHESFALRSVRLI